METNFVTNVHEVVYAGFLAKDCPANEVRILSKFYKVSLIVFKAGNVSYNAVMAANTIITDFFVSNHRLFAREIALEFVENIMTLLFSYDGFWDFVNRLNIHFFYLTYRSQILQILSYHMSLTYGSEHFTQVYRRLPPYVFGAEDFSQERGKSSNFSYVKESFLFTCSCRVEFLILKFSFTALFSQLWRDQFNETDSGRFANMAKVMTR
jgi:hypothetical protein